MGYDDEKQAFRFKNSWGDSWGDQGYGWLSYDFVKELVKKSEALVPTKQKLAELPQNASLLEHQRRWLELLDNMTLTAP